MRSFSLISVGVALSIASLSYAVPASISTVIQPPGMPAAATLQLISPTNVPSPKAPAPNLPVRRKYGVDRTARIQPRQLHSPDYGATPPNATTPQSLPSSSGASITKRIDSVQADTFGSSGFKPYDTADTTSIQSTTGDAQRKHAKDKATGNDRSSLPSGAAAPDLGTPFGAATGGIRAVSAVPNGASSVVYSLPVNNVPSTPITQADPGPGAAQANQRQAAPKQNTAAQPHVAGAANADPAGQPLPEAGGQVQHNKRHSFVMDTDPIIPPAQNPDEPDASKRDPMMGLVNVDSNAKATPPKKDKPRPSPEREPGRDSQVAAQRTSTRPGSQRMRTQAQAQQQARPAGGSQPNGNRQGAQTSSTNP